MASASAKDVVSILYSTTIPSTSAWRRRRADPTRTIVTASASTAATAAIASRSTTRASDVTSAIDTPASVRLPATTGGSVGAGVGAAGHRGRQSFSPSAHACSS